MAPAIAFLGVFLVYPVLNTVLISLYGPTSERFVGLGHAVFCRPHFLLGARIDCVAEAFVEHHFFRVVGPALDEGVAPEDLFHLSRW